MDAPKPLGYWLQHLHNVLEAHFALVLSDVGIDRRQWQLLNTLARGPQSRDDLARALAPFWTAEEPGPDRSLSDFAARGWTTESGGALALTPVGVATQADLSRRVDQARAVVLQGLSPDQYGETVRILSVMAGNAEAAIAARAEHSPMP